MSLTGDSKGCLIGVTAFRKHLGTRRLIELHGNSFTLRSQEQEDLAAIRGILLLPYQIETPTPWPPGANKVLPEERDIAGHR